MQLLKSSHRVYKPVEMLARLYILDSLSYPEEAKYWLKYATKLAGQHINDLETASDSQTLAEKKALTHMKRVQVLECAFLIDQDEGESAELILKAMLKQVEFSDDLQERDVEMIANSLYGIIAGAESEEGQQALQKAQLLVKDFGGKYEQRQWLRLPLFLA